MVLHDHERFSVVGVHSYGNYVIIRNGEKKGWLAPSIDHKLQTHIRLIEKLKKILPISELFCGKVVLLLVAFMA